MIKTLKFEEEGLIVDWISFKIQSFHSLYQGRFIIEYWGKIVPDAVADKIAGRYLFDLENGRVLRKRFYKLIR